jgi:hypothetical protein
MKYFLFFLLFLCVTSRSLEDRVADLERDSVNHYKEIIQRLKTDETLLQSLFLNENMLQHNTLFVCGVKFFISGVLFWGALILLMVLKSLYPRRETEQQESKLQDWIEKKEEDEPFHYLLFQFILPGIGNYLIGQKKKGIILISQMLYSHLFHFLYLNIFIEMYSSNQDSVLIFISFVVYFFIFSIFISFYISTLMDFYFILKRFQSNQIHWIHV